MSTAVRHITASGVAGSLSHLREVSTHHVRTWVSPGERADIDDVRGEPITRVRTLSDELLLTSVLSVCVKEKTRMVRRGDIITRSVFFGSRGYRKSLWSWPANAEALRALALTLWDMYRECAPAVARRHGALPRRVRTIDGTAWTTGTINANCAAGYHRDASNAQGCWSGMLVLADKCSGGDLVLPEFGIGIRCGTGSVVLFNGGEHTHGVTPITLLPGGYRYSVPFYTLTES